MRRSAEQQQWHEQQQKIWYSLGVEEVAACLGVADPQAALPQQEAEERLAKYGNNAQEEKEESRLKTLLEPFREPMTVLLLATPALSAALGEIIDAIPL